MLRDLRHAFRMLLQAKGWTAVVVLSLAVGIGANAAIFTAVNALLLRKLSIDDPDSLVRIRWAGDNDMMNSSSDYGLSGRTRNGPAIYSTFSYPMFEHFQSANQTMLDIAGAVPLSEVTVVIDGRAETANALLTTGNYYQMLGVTARPGRPLDAKDDNASSPPVAMVSDRFWRTRLGGSEAAIGKVIRVNNLPVTIVGVASAEFAGTQRITRDLHDLLLPIRLDTQISGERSRTDGPPRLDDPTFWWVQLIGRLKPGVAFEQVRGNLEGVFQSQARVGMQDYLASLSDEERNRSDNQGRVTVPTLVVDSGNRGTYDVPTTETDALTIVAVIVALVLLLVCANVANLLLARVTARQREISVRLSMGATRFRVIRQLLTESLLLAALGGGIGVLIARWSQAMLPPPVGTSAPDWRVVIFALAITMLAGLMFGIAPAFRATRMEIGAALKVNSRSIASSNATLSRVLLVAQVSISLVLLVGAGLFLRTLSNLRTVDIGWDPQNLVFVRVYADAAHLDNEYKLRFYTEGINRLQQVPGVRAVTLARPTLMSGNTSGTTIYVQGRVYPRGRQGEVDSAGTNVAQDENHINYVVVGPNYFETMGIPLVLGRTFTEHDNAKAPKVAIINQAAARKFFRTDNPIGRRFGMSVETVGEYEVVGILRDVKYTNLREQPPATMYVPHLQSRPDEWTFTVRTALPPGAVMNAARTAIANLDPNIPVTTVETQMTQLERRFSNEKVLAQAYTLFSAIAVFVAAIGLFGVMSYNVARRTREIGIRMAMGAQKKEVLGLVLRESMLLVVFGIIIGIAASLAAGRLVASQLFGLQPTDPATMVAATVVMLAVSAMAGYLPARRAARVDPMVALRYE